MRPLPALAHTLALSLLFAACADTSGRPIGTGKAEEPRPPLPATLVEVTNHNWSMVSVYAYISGTKVRLGQVETAGSARLPLPSRVHATGEVEILIDPLASNQEYWTGPIMIAPGTVVEVVVENNLALSYVRVRGS